METQELRTLKILEAVEQEEAPSQRDLARRLNVSLGLVNSFIKRLVGKGYFKVTTIPRNRVRYILTPKGAAEKTRLTYEYIQYSFQFYKDARKRMKRMLKKVAAEGGRRVVFFGAGDLAEIAFLTIQETDMKMVAIVDPDLAGGRFFGRPIESPEFLETADCDCVLITCIEERKCLKEEIEKRTGGRCPVISGL